MTKLKATILTMLSALLCMYLLSLPVSTLAEETSSEKKSALTIVESNDDDVNDGVVSDESSGEENDQIDEQLDTNEKFEPTNKWKKVKKGQRIPDGLHVRMNLQTGEQEAKLMDDESKQTDVKHWDAGKDIGIINTEKKRFSRDELKQVVKDFKLKDTNSKQPQDQEDVKAKYHSYEELKKVMEEMQMNVKTEAEIVTELVKTLKQPDINTEDLKTLLVDIEYYVHQIDNGKLFCDLGGMKRLLALMNNTDDDIRAKAVHVLGAALQSNGKVQVEAIEHGVLQQLVTMLSTDQSPPVRKKSMFALSSLLRQFPFAQKKFLAIGGLSALGGPFFKTVDPSLRVKTITLLTDLVEEYDLDVREQNSDDEIDKERSRQYSEVKMRQAMKADGWCNRLTTLLEDLTEHDDVEKTVTAMTVMTDACAQEFSISRPKLTALASHYDNLAKEDVDDTDSYFASIFTAVERLLKQIPFQREDL